MDLIWPFVVLLGAVLLLAATPNIAEGIQHARAGWAVIRDDIVVHRARQTYQRMVKR